MSTTPLLPCRQHVVVQHHLSPAALSMLAIGGTVGTGLFFSVVSIIQHGPLIALASMCYVAFLVVIVLQLTGELAVFLPENGLICKFLFMFLGRLVGLANNLIYWMSWNLTFALELSIIVNMCRFWGPDWVDKHQTVLIIGTWMVLTAFNLLPVNVYGKIELWIASIKVGAIMVWIVVVVASLARKGDVFGTWTADWPASFVGSTASWPKYAVNFINCLIFLSFVFQSVESVAITTGDILHPHVTIPQTIKLVFVRIVVFYLMSVLLLTLVIPTGQKLIDPAADNILSSPFMIALLNCGFHDNPALLTGFNLVILSAIISAANSNVYFGSRCLQAIVESHGMNTRWSIFASTNKQNVPVHAVLFSAVFGLVALLLRFQSIEVIFNFLLTCCALAGMLMWCLLCVSYIRFRQALDVHGVSLDELKWRSTWRLYPWAWFALVNLVVILCCNGLTNLWDFSFLALLGSYMTPAVFCLLCIYFEWTNPDGLVLLEDIDVWRGNLVKGSPI